LFFSITKQQRFLVLKKNKEALLLLEEALQKDPRQVKITLPSSSSNAN